MDPASSPLSYDETILYLARRNEERAERNLVALPGKPSLVTLQRNLQLSISCRALLPFLLSSVFATHCGSR